MKNRILTISSVSYQISKKFILSFSIALLTFLSAQLRIYLPFTPVPITFQTFVVLTSSAIFNWKIATMSQILYLLMGLIGIPVFANKLTGLTALLHPSSGYIIGFVISSFIISNIFKKLKPSKSYLIFLLLLLGNLIIYFFGLIRLSITFGIKKSLLIGVLPFLYGDLIKIILAVPIIKNLSGKIK